MKTNEINAILEVAKKFGRVSKRVEELSKLGYHVSERRCGSGGKFRAIELKNEIRVQIGYAHGKNNYAQCVILSK